MHAATASTQGRDAYTVTRIQFTELAGIQDEWLALLERSDANPWFLSPFWLSTWWTTWGSKQADAEDIVLIARDEQGGLVGLAPLYRITDAVRGRVRANRIQFIGANFRRAGITRTEYLDFVLDQENRDAVLKALLDHLFGKFDFDELCLSDMRLDSPSRPIILATGERSGALIRYADHDSSTVLTLDGTFEDYLATLGKNTRLRVFNRRKVLEKEGEVRLRSFSRDELLEGFDILSRLFESRWGSPIFTPEQLEFQTSLVAAMPETAELALTTVVLDSEPVSAVYDIRYGGVEYNFLQGFKADVHPKVSMGMLHFGYAIERAYASGIRRFDFLLGKGKSSDYKEHFKGETVQTNTVQVVRKPILKLLYRLYGLRGRWLEN